MTNKEQNPVAEASAAQRPSNASVLKKYLNGNDLIRIHTRDSLYLVETESFEYFDNAFLTGYDAQQAMPAVEQFDNKENQYMRFKPLYVRFPALVAVNSIVGNLAFVLIEPEAYPFLSTGKIFKSKITIHKQDIISYEKWWLK